MRIIPFVCLCNVQMSYTIEAIRKHVVFENGKGVEVRKGESVLHVHVVDALAIAKKTCISRQINLGYAFDVLHCFTSK